MNQMKTMTNIILHKISRCASAVLLGIAASSYGSVADINVTVSDASGKVAFRGATKPNSTFATGNLQPGDYVVQFTSDSPVVSQDSYLLVVSAGKKKVIADSVAGQKITGRGVAMRVAVRTRSNITGQVANVITASNGSNVNVRGDRRYVWLAGQTGTNLGGHWVEEGSADSRNIVRWDANEIRLLQDRSDEGSQVNRVGKRTKFTGL
jgi:hypothetical protein